ncbi:bifunctional phosphopantothenoylcysteine decarboxylase/phosphopantothenate--cysteine ligase CoaBC [Larkinella rosea]|uniref:Coenzyme A biosynthesis bifunctional protein CoaBC n=1 Tax=Larkinella rosea TaxID=2025312 RepID=A0A3P1C2L2_9BACT|nr:bifunctional phosphopantothenoylcysteine decarboxylase/phosphopantothenate--cysteine ligase CoaBC [Larkinella rosea]RRB07518.1 bifunctional phosphopantothenoylcysteine decarboxylase/phosphopantothenate--cysteine ligase CoaBC [Larkinella rosea]
MSNLTGKKIILGVTGSISAYKSALLTRLLVKSGAEVQVLMTRAARDFITPLTLATLSKRPVLSEFTSSSGAGEGQWNNHVELALWADLIVVAPVSAHSLARFAHGFCDDLLAAVYLSARCPIFLAPAMDLDMYHHPATLENLRRLETFGNRIIQAEHGELASGLVGEGRLAEPEHILVELERHFAQRPVFRHKQILITAGPTQEPIDPVRFISNHSSGKMGYAIARAFAHAGADVTLISGPTVQPLPDPTIRRISVRSAREMFDATAAEFSKAHIIVLAAAVADYTPAEPAQQKIKKKEAVFALQMTKTIDIAATLGKQKRPDQITVGFALETNDELSNAVSKLRAKNFDFIVLNSLRDPGAGFGHDTNKITVIDKDEQVYEFDLKSKDKVAEDLLNLVQEQLAMV